MSLAPLLYIGLPLLVVLLLLALWPWRRRATAFGVPGVVLALCLFESRHFELSHDGVTMWLWFLGAPTLAALTGLARAAWRFRTA